MKGKLTATEAERKTIVKLLPLINKISDARLRDLVIEVWARLWRESPFDISQAPNYRDEKFNGHETLIRHTNTVVKMSLAAAREFQRAYGASIDNDTLLAGGILHDVDKLAVYERQGSTIQLSELGRRVNHTEYGARVAAQVGLSKEVVNIIAAHSFTYRKALPATIEAVLIAYCDAGNAEAYHLMPGKRITKEGTK